MLTVRFPNGQAIQYNTATYVTYTDTQARLWTRKDGEWVATVFISSGAVIESQKACRVYNPITQTGDMIGWLMDNMRRLSWSELGKLAELKVALKDFNAQHRRWK